MKWEDVKKGYSEQWVIIEAIIAHSEGEERIIDDLAIVDVFGDDNSKALHQYVELHRTNKERELYVVHTSRPELDIIEKSWIGVRAN